jgi:protein-tyrosine phosphatase
MAEALMRHRAGEAGSTLEVSSAGFLTEGQSPPPDTVKVMERRGIDVAEHVSRMVAAEDLRGADLVVGMTRTHVWDAALLEPTALTRSFVFGELVRLNESIGHRRSDEPFGDWIERLNGARNHGIVGSAQREEIPDPYGRRTRAHERAAREIEKLALELADCAFDPSLSRYEIRWREGKLIWEA